MHKIGFMEGRLSPLVDGRIQSFPWLHWKQEFISAQKINIHIMEWTIDNERLYENPLLTKVGQKEIRVLCQRHDIRIPSLTGDCFMQAPLWKSAGESRAALECDFYEIAKGCAAVGISMIVVPLVDNGRLEDLDQENILVQFLEKQSEFLASLNLQVIFESDFAPSQLARFISRLDPVLFGINYDIGNSAALGFNPAEEFAFYGHRILNVHIKDRVFGGTTVALGTGNANFEAVFKELNSIYYQGNFILQTARAENDDHVTPLARNRDMVAGWIDQFGL